jgi:multidrug efflux pump subunit AcrA (membrane-fusion protein)
VNYESFLKERRSLEEDLLELIDISRAGAVRAPFDGTVSSVEYNDGSDSNSGSGGGNGGAGDMNDDMDDFDDFGGGDPDSSGSSGGGDSSGASDQTGLVTLAPDKEMSLTISVDETGILSLEVGQTAQVTVNSIGEMFTGSVTEINRSSSGQSGVTNYTAVITMPKDPRMMSGMSAKAVVRIQGVAGAILIPEAALHQSRDAAFVYTSYNEETKEFGDPVSVTRGLSDGEMVEIIEGLKEGDTVYYTVSLNPWEAMMYGTAGNASSGDAWVETGDEMEEYGDEDWESGVYIESDSEGSMDEG